MPISRWRAAAVLLPLALLAACGDDQGTVGVAPAPDQLSGRVFVGADVTGHQLVSGSSLRLDFRDGLSANAGCNHLGGSGALQDGTLVATIDMMTEMGCEQARMDQDTWFVDFLQSRPTASVDESVLVLAKDGTTVRLTDEAAIHAQHPISLKGTTWTLESLIDGAGPDGAVSSVPGGVAASIVLEAGHLTVDTGCNRGSADLQIADDSLTVGPLALTKMACDTDATSVENAFTRVLAGEVDYVQDYDVLTLTSADGSSGLQFRAR